MAGRQRYRSPRPRESTASRRSHLGLYQISFTLTNFATARREAAVPASGAVRVDAVLHLALSADVTVTGRRTFANLADVEDPAANLVGVAQSASQGAITARQLNARPMTRAGEVLETVPGVIISQHSGEGKATQYYYASRLPGEPGGGVSDVHFHPTLPRTARINLAFCF